MAKKKGAGGSFALPRGEVIWVQYRDGAGELRYVMTSKGADMNTADRSTYFMYGLAEGEWKKLGRGKRPAELEEKYVRLNG